MKKHKANFFATREKVREIEKALKTLSKNQLITINGGLERFEQSIDDGSDYKNYAESTSYSRHTAYAKLRS